MDHRANERRPRRSNGESSIYRDRNGRWHGRVSMGTTDDGRPDRRHVTAATQRDVAAKVRELERARDTGRAATAGRAPTVQVWLTHWVERIAAPSVRPKSLAAYRTAVYRHLMPGIGRHRLDRLTPEHIESMYAAMLDSGLSPGTVHQTHRTLRTALGEAFNRGRISTNPAARARPPRLTDLEIEPLTIDEAKAILAAASVLPNGVRFSIALALGLRQGEALGLQWNDLDLDADPPTLTVRRALQRIVWRHGCGQPATCGRTRGADCPDRTGGGLTLVPPKSRAGRRVIPLPPPLVQQLRTLRDQRVATEGWADKGLVFCQPDGRPLDPRADLRSWKALLNAANVRDARLHDARHTAATMLLVQGVDSRTVMDLLGWSHITMTRRYQHVVDALRTDATRRVAELLWPN
ncbi:MAG TPA: tyrosine-type recombinase/integrase [Mycobacteriales bacterium]|nr:tyrosine-type recombinase/integrase [Mycobacteriales bacterium]